MSNVVYNYLSSNKFNEYLSSDDIKIVKSLLGRIREVIDSKIPDLNEAIQASNEDIVYAGYLEAKVQGLLEETTLNLESTSARLSKESKAEHYAKNSRATVASIENDVKSSKEYQSLVKAQIAIKEILTAVKAIKLASIKKRDSLDQVCNNERLQLRDIDYA